MRVLQKFNSAMKKKKKMKTKKKRISDKLLENKKPQ